MRVPKHRARNRNNAGRPNHQPCHSFFVVDAAVPVVPDGFGAELCSGVVWRGSGSSYCSMPETAKKDPLLTLRQYRQIAPWNLHDFTAVTGALLEASGVRPTNAAAKAQPSDRTIRYYIARGLMAPPEGRGTAATYSYRHLLQLLVIKLRQMEGAPLSSIARELKEQTGDVIERRVAAALGPNIVPASQLSLRDPTATRGRAGRAIHTWNALGKIADDGSETGKRFATTKWHRIPIVRGLELNVHEGHPAAKHISRSSEIADAVRLAVNRVLISDS